MTINQAELKEFLDYNPNTGVFTWKKKFWKSIVVGKVAGSFDSEGYQQIQVNKRVYRAHRLAWLFVHGSFPEKQIDHINGDRSDNRITNLRDVSCSVNNRNRKIHINGRLLGVTFFKDRKKWASQIIIDRKRYHLGFFETELEAHNKYREKFKEHYGFCHWEVHR